MQPISKSVVPFQDLPLADRDRPWDKAAAEARVRRFAGGPKAEDMDWGRYRRAFLWWDSDAPELFGSYSFLIADVIGGRLRAVPRGIFAAAAVLSGARGGTTLPADDQDRMRGHLSRYYEKMADEFDDQFVVAPWEKAKGAVEIRRTSRAVSKRLARRRIARRG